MSQTRTRTATVAADGTATILFQPYSATPWTVTQVSTELASAPVGATCALRLARAGDLPNSFLITPMVATGDVAGGDPPVDVAPEDILLVAWKGCTPGTLAKALVIYEVPGP
jgi:hypothetical protein